MKSNKSKLNKMQEDNKKFSGQIKELNAKNKEEKEKFEKEREINLIESK